MQKDRGEKIPVRDKLRNCRKILWTVIELKKDCYERNVFKR